MRRARACLAPSPREGNRAAGGPRRWAPRSANFPPVPRTLPGQSGSCEIDVCRRGYACTYWRNHANGERREERSRAGTSGLQRAASVGKRAWVSTRRARVVGGSQVETPDAPAPGRGRRQRKEEENHGGHREHGEEPCRSFSVSGRSAVGFASRPAAGCSPSRAHRGGLRVHHRTLHIPTFPARSPAGTHPRGVESRELRVEREEGTRGRSAARAGPLSTVNYELSTSHTRLCRAQGGGRGRGRSAGPVGFEASTGLGEQSAATAAGRDTHDSVGGRAPSV